MVEQKSPHTQTRVSLSLGTKDRLGVCQKLKMKKRLRFHGYRANLTASSEAPSPDLLFWSEGLRASEKSTLLLRLCGNICDTYDVLCVTGEESDRQLKLQAQRLESGRDVRSRTDRYGQCYQDG